MAASIPARFDRMVARDPAALAVKTGARALSYGELDAVSNGLARALLDGARARPSAVALLCEPGVARAVGVLACLKAGAAYVPLEAGNPPERNARIAADAGVALAIADPDLARALPPELPWIDPAAAPAEPAPPAVPRPPGALTCILYTSGSTGAPKGVVYTDDMVLARVVGHNRFAVGPGDRLTALGGGGMNLFRALLTGAALCSLEARSHGVGPLPDWLRRERITLYHSVPTLFRHLVAVLDRAPRAGFPGLRVVNLTGETVLAPDVDGFRRHFAPPCELVNGLGTTEAGTFRELRVTHATRLLSPVVPVGVAVEGTEVRLLDAAGAPVPAGALGEIAVCGEHLAAGYWNQPVLTAERFLPAPAGARGRMYRTGDLGRFLADGSLVHLGRDDHQIKVRGHRVEPGEIEARLLAAPGVREAAVVGARDEGVTRLCAYVVAAPGAALTARELRAFLHDRVPDYMIPAAFVALDALPLTPNGKVDRLGLPRAGGRSLDEASVGRPPAGALETYLAGLWSSVLPVGVTGVDAEFLALGGNSLLATEMARRLCDHFGLDIPLALILEHPTIATLAEALLALTSAEPSAPRSPSG